MKKISLGIGFIALLLGAATISTGTTLAYKGNPTVKGPNYSVDRHEAMTKAFENNDYNTWKGLMQGKGRVTQVINQDNFAKFAEAHRLILEGKNAEAQKIRQELGLGLKNSSGKMGRGLNH